MTLDNFSPIQDRYIDVGAGGPTPFTFTVLSNVTWLKVSTPRGSISPNAPEHRVFVSVPNWNQLDEGENHAVVSFTATASAGQPALVVPVFFIATKNTPSSGFKGMRVLLFMGKLSPFFNLTVDPPKDLWRELV